MLDSRRQRAPTEAHIHYTGRSDEGNTADGILLELRLAAVLHFINKLQEERQRKTDYHQNAGQRNPCAE